MGQDTQLNLGIVRVHEHTAFLGNKHFADFPAQGHADRDILKVRLRAADASRSRDSLVEFAVNPSVLTDIGCQAFRIGGIQLCQLAVIQNFLDHRIIRRQLFQHIRCRGITCLCLFSSRKLHPLKENLSQLLGGIDIELMACLLVDFLFQLGDSHLKPVPIFFKLSPFHLHALLLHMEKAVNQGHLYICIQAVHSSFL